MSVTPNYTERRYAVLRSIKAGQKCQSSRALMECVRVGLIEWERDALGRMNGDGTPQLTRIGADCLKAWGERSAATRAELLGRVCELEQRLHTLELAINKTLTDNAHLSDGDECTLAHLKGTLATRGET